MLPFTGYPISIAVPFVVNYSLCDHALSIININSKQEAQIPTEKPAIQLITCSHEEALLISYSDNINGFINIFENQTLISQYEESFELPPKSQLICFDDSGAYIHNQDYLCNICKAHSYDIL